MDEFGVAPPGSSLHFNTKAFCHKVLAAARRENKFKQQKGNQC
jgi:hypothetical protein